MTEKDAWWARIERVAAEVRTWPEWMQKQILMKRELEDDEDDQDAP